MHRGGEEKEVGFAGGVWVWVGVGVCVWGGGGGGRRGVRHGLRVVFFCTDVWFLIAVKYVSLLIH